MDELEKIGEFNLYDRVRIKGTNITGNIVLIHNVEDCEVEYDSEFQKDGNVIYTHNINELEKE